MQGIGLRVVRMACRARPRRGFALGALEFCGFGTVAAAGFAVHLALGLLIAGGAMVYLANVLPPGDDGGGDADDSKTP